MPHTISCSSVSAETAHRLVAAAVAAAREADIAVSVAVVDHSGELAAFLRMDGAYLASGQIATDKAYSAAAFQMGTHAWPKTLDSDSALARLATSVRRLVPLGGGLPITVKGAVIGAIGISGGHYAQDVTIAKAAVAEVLSDRSGA